MPYVYLTTVSGLCLGLFYLAGVGALAALTGLNGHVDGDQAAMLLGLAGISAPLWALHWAWLRQIWARYPQATAASRARYLQTAVTGGLVVTLATGWRAATDLVAVMLGGERLAVASLAMFGVSGLLWLYHVFIVRSDLNTLAQG
jgi:hypothetical protein